MSHITFPPLTSGGEPYYLQLYRHILKEIKKGGLQAGKSFLLNGPWPSIFR